MKYMKGMKKEAGRCYGRLHVLHDALIFDAAGADIRGFVFVRYHGCHHVDGQ